MTKIDPKPAPARYHDQLEVVAEGHGRYIIDVSLPARIEPGAKVPVVLVVDGNLHFDSVQVAVNGLFAEETNSLGRGFMPASIVVGVGYPKSEGLLSFMVRRTFDFYDPWDMEDAVGQAVHEHLKAYAAAEGLPEMEVRAGGYEGFMAFLRDDLLPALAEHYPIDLKARHTLIGHSSGGYFALRALYDPKSPFSRYVIGSAAGGAPGAIEKAEAAYAADHTDLAADVFLCVGAAELEGLWSATARFASTMVRAAELFTHRQWPNGRLVWETMNNEDHYSVVPRAIAAGLRSVHGTRPAVGAAIQAARGRILSDGVTGRPTRRTS
jgi:predicted alpha/beta superfamily hydrolase